MWTKFWDMHSGGGQKLDWAKIYVEAPEDEAVAVFYNRFGRSPHRVTCTCCGEDYSVTESKTLGEATEYHRKLGGGGRLTVKEYSELPSVKIVRADGIKPEERECELPEEGYVWQD